MAFRLPHSTPDDLKLISAYISVSEAASLLRKSKQSIYNDISKKVFIRGTHYFKPSGKVLFLQSALLEYLQGDISEVNSPPEATQPISDKEQSAKTDQKRNAKRVATNTGDKAGDMYNWAYPISDVLKEYGWKRCMGKKGNYWTRPEKKSGVSGSVFDDSVFWCFTSSTRLEPDALYDSFGLLARYEFNGDFTAAAVYESMRDAV